jgi:hypothetical protein
MTKEIKKDKAYFENLVKLDRENNAKYVNSYISTEQYKKDVRTYAESFFPTKSEEATRLMMKLISCCDSGQATVSQYIQILKDPSHHSEGIKRKLIDNIKTLLKGKELTNTRYGYSYNELVPTKVLDK